MLRNVEPGGFLQSSSAYRILFPHLGLELISRATFFIFKPMVTRQRKIQYTFQLQKICSDNICRINVFRKIQGNSDEISFAAVNNFLHLHISSKQIDIAFTIKEGKLSFFILFHIKTFYVGASQMHWQRWFDCRIFQTNCPYRTNRMFLC